MAYIVMPVPMWLGESHQTTDMSYVVMAYVGMVYIVMAYIVNSLYSYRLYSYGLYRCSSANHIRPLIASRIGHALNLLYMP